MMLTRCPGCTTTFRVTPEQVKARHGKVRCGLCQNVFDAIEHLVDAQAAAPTVESESIPAVPVPVATPAPMAEAPEEAAEVAAPALVSEDKAEPLPAPADAAPDQTDAATLDADTQQPEPEGDILLQPSPLSTSYAQTQVPRQVGWPWTLASTLVFIALVAQLMLAYRVDLAVKYPGVRPLLEMLCDHAQCTVELPSDPDLVSIEASDLHPAKKGGLELTATLRNRAPHAQAWPQLELTLTDGADKPIVRKVIAPEQYLPATQSEADGFTANGEQAVQLLLDAGTLPAAGYRLYLFYP